MPEETEKVTEEAVTPEVTEQQQEQEPGENAAPGEDAAPEKPDEPEKAEAKAPAKRTGVKKTGAKDKQVKVPETWSERATRAAAKDAEKMKEIEAKRKAEAKGEKAPRERDPDVILGHKATALATRGSVSKEGVLTVGERKFGAACNATQVKAIREQVKGKNILQFLGGVSEKALKEYAQGDIKATELPESCKKALKELNAKFPPKMKMWPRKDAALLYVLHAERKAAQKKAAPKKEKVAA
jgi:hypothetical protein